MMRQVLDESTKSLFTAVTVSKRAKNVYEKRTICVQTSAQLIFV